MMQIDRARSARPYTVRLVSSFVVLTLLGPPVSMAAAADLSQRRSPCTASCGLPIGERHAVQSAKPVGAPMAIDPMATGTTPLAPATPPLARAPDPAAVPPPPIGTMPLSNDRYDRPDPSRIVAVRQGSIMIATPAELAAARRQRAAMLKSIERPVLTPAE